SDRPVLTRNLFGLGRVYYLAARVEHRMIDEMMSAIVAEAGIESVWPERLPYGVNAQARTDGESDFTFLMNFNDHPAAGLPPYGCEVRRCPTGSKP
ncbi:MAG: Beta-galactosidase C-terminal domain, partial [Spirochaetaceae bacterium]|nr:Beta-galactosidase C-terminal domain [Spirochaetaceae bacterium]